MVYYFDQTLHSFTIPVYITQLTAKFNNKATEMSNNINAIVNNLDPSALSLVRGVGLHWHGTGVKSNEHSVNHRLFMASAMMASKKDLTRRQ